MAKTPPKTKKGSNYVCLSIITFDSVYNMHNHYELQVVLEKGKYEKIEMKKTRYITEKRRDFLFFFY